ncbi:hypothetical protein KR026_000494 [Drosophila bipectinata]|nr:hypothetical protein KR026_000494 [Drosophila bipectinata]
MCTTTTSASTTVVSGSGDASTDPIGQWMERVEGSDSQRSSWPQSWHRGQRLNLRIFKLLISSCVLMLCIYTNAWHLSIRPGQGSGSGSGWVMASSIKGRGDAYRLDEIDSLSHTSSSSRLSQNNNHANISELLDNLLRGYDNSVRPGFGGPPATVEVDIMVRSMGPISEMDMTYSMDCYFRQSWVDKRLAFEGAQDTLALSISMLGRIWKPDTYFYNGKQSYLHTITTPNKFVRIYQNGRVLYSSRLTIKAGCPMNLADFPMDIQKCPLKFGSFGYTTSDVIYRWNKERPAVAIAEDMKLSQFDLVDCPAGNLTDIVYKASSMMPDDPDHPNAQRPRPTSKVVTTFAGPAAKNQHIRGTGIKLDKGAFGTGRDAAGGAVPGNNIGGTITLETNHPLEYSMLLVNFHLQRHMGNFLIQVYGPCCLLVVLSWVSFWLNREATSDRVSLGITTVLTMTFLGLEARTDLPKVSYPTALDFFVFLSFAFIFATILQFAVVHYFTKYGSGEAYFLDNLEPEPQGKDSETKGPTPDLRGSTEDKIYEVIPLSTCSINIPHSAASSRFSIPGSQLRGPRNRRHDTWTERLLHFFGWRPKSRPPRVNFSSDEDEDDEETQFRIDDDGPSTSAQAAAKAAAAAEAAAAKAAAKVAEKAKTEERSSPPPKGRRRMSSYRREEIEARKTGKRVPQFNSVSKIDRISRIVFPLLFLLINVIYWYCYLSRSSRILANTPDAST